MHHSLEVITPPVALVLKNVVPMVNLLGGILCLRHLMNVLLDILQHHIKLAHATIFIIFVRGQFLFPIVVFLIGDTLSLLSDFFRAGCLSVS